MEITPETPAPAYTPRTCERNKAAVSQILHTEVQRNGTGQSRFIAALPLDQLKDGPAPVDCPACGFRGLTERKFVAGDVTR